MTIFFKVVLITFQTYSNDDINDLFQNSSGEGKRKSLEKIISELQQHYNKDFRKKNNLLIKKRLVEKVQKTS